MTKMTIENIAKLTDAALKAKIESAGFEVPEGTTRFGMIAIARANDLWKYVGNVVPETYKARYGKLQRCGDEISEAVNGATRDANGNVDLDALTLLQDANGIDGNRWAHCNVGQKVMNTSNVLRGRAKRGEYVIIGGQEWNTEKKPAPTKMVLENPPTVAPLFEDEEGRFDNEGGFIASSEPKEVLVVKKTRKASKKKAA